MKDEWKNSSVKHFPKSKTINLLRYSRMNVKGKLGKFGSFH